MEIVLDQSLHADDVADAVARLVTQQGKPGAIKVGNGSEFADRVMDRWALVKWRGAEFFPARNADGQRDGGMLEWLRQECLNEH